NRSKRKHMANLHKSPQKHPPLNYHKNQMHNQNSFHNVPKYQDKYNVCPHGSIFFLLGFLFPPLWWFGSIYPRKPLTSSEVKWKNYNKLMSILSSVIICAIIAILIWYLRFY